MVRCAIVLCLAVALPGCTTNSTARARASAAYSAGQQQAYGQLQSLLAPSVSFSGNVTNPRLAWREGLSLAEAIVAADYRSVSSPRAIFVIRHGQRNFVDPKQLLSGQDFLLEAGDVIEIQ